MAIQPGQGTGFPERSVRPPSWLWRIEAAHPVLVNAAWGFILWFLNTVVFGFAWWAGLPYLVGWPLLRGFLWRRGGFLRRKYEERVAASTGDVS
jgi:hypothetical protein